MQMIGIQVSVILCKWRLVQDGDTGGLQGGSGSSGGHGGAGSSGRHGGSGVSGGHGRMRSSGGQLGRPWRDRL